MPEGPEVTVLTDKLNYELKNKKISNIIINPKSRYKNKLPVNYNDFIKKLPTKVLFIKNKGKLITGNIKTFSIKESHKTEKWKKDHKTLLSKMKEWGHGSTPSTQIY